MLSHALWTARYGADPGIVGRTVRIDGTAHTVVGVMPPAFNFPWNEVRLWVPMREDAALEPRTNTAHIIVGRLNPGWTAERARDELLAIQRELGALHPDADGRFTGVTVRPLREALNFAYDVVRAGFLVLLAVVGAVLLIACINVASLVLARGTVRAPEMAVRLALGAGRGRLARQLLTESLVLAVAGGALGLALAYAAVAAIGPRLPEALFRVGTATLDGRVLVFSLVLTVLTPLVFGLTPSLAATRADLAGMLKEGGRGAGVGRRSLRGRQSLVVAQVALAVILLTAAGLMVRSFLAIQRVDLGFDADRMLVVEVSPPAYRYDGSAALGGYYDRAAAALAALPGVRAAAAVDPLPLNHEEWTLQFARPEGSGAAREDWPVALQARTSPGYFDAAGITLVAGRDFGAADDADAPPVVIVSRGLAERHWPGQNPVGRMLLLDGEGPARGATVIGVVDDPRLTGLTGEIRPQLYRPLTQAPTRRRFLIVTAADGSPAALTGSVRNALAGIDESLPVTIRPMSEVVRENDFQWRLGSMALAGFGAAALLLAALGLYGIIAYSMVQRRRELGIRLALGATASQIRGLVVGEGLRVTGLGLAIGVVLALAAARLLASQLFGVRPYDPATLAVVLILFIAVAAAASIRPAARAAALAPQQVLREE